MKPYIATCVEVCMTCCTKPELFERQIRYHALNAIASVILASEEQIIPYMQQMLEFFYKIIKENA